MKTTQIFISNAFQSLSYFTPFSYAQTTQTPTSSKKNTKGKTLKNSPENSNSYFTKSITQQITLTKFTKTPPRAYKN